MSKLQRTSFALPEPILQWLESEARQAEMSRNSFLVLQLSLLKHSQTLNDRIERLERAVTQLEKK